MNTHAGKLELGVLDQRISTNKRKGIAEFGDIQRPTAININPDHRSALTENPFVFKRSNGQFTHLYDSAARFGESKVFRH